jgi:hypothetical protein
MTKRMDSTTLMQHGAGRTARRGEGTKTPSTKVTYGRGMRVLRR